MDEDVINMSGLEMFAITSNLPKIDDSNYKRVNSFAHEFDNIKYNYVFSNPPYGGDKIIETASQIKKKAIIQHIKSTIKTEDLKHNKQYINLCEEVKQFKKNTQHKVTSSSCSKRIKAFAKKYDLKSNDKEGCSLLLLMDLLSKDGTCCAVLKEGVFFDNSYADIIKVLIENFNITNIISIPSDAFESTTTKTSAIILYAAAIIFFCFFYTALVFNSRDTADNLKKSGAFVPGIRPGDQTARYIDKILVRLTLAGAIYMVLVCLLPEFLVLKYNVPFYFGGTSLLIIVVVAMDFMAQVQSFVMQQQYGSLMKKANFKMGPTL